MPLPGARGAGRPATAHPIPKGRFTAAFLARLLVDKCVLGRPLHRIAAALGHDGLDVADGTLVGVLAAVSGLLAPLAAAIRARNAAAGHLHVDETSWQVFATVAGKANHRWWCWVFVGPDTTVFRIEPCRWTAVLTEHLGIDLSAGALEQGRQLLVSSDFFTVYQALGTLDGVDPLWWGAHIRRQVIRAGDAHRELAAWSAAWVERIGVLYAAHRALAATALGGPDRDRDACAVVGGCAPRGEALDRFLVWAASPVDLEDWRGGPAP